MVLKQNLYSEARYMISHPWHWNTEYMAYSSFLWCTFAIWTMWFEFSDVLTSVTNLSISLVPSIRLRPWHSMSMHINCNTMARYYMLFLQHSFCTHLLNKGLGWMLYTNWLLSENRMCVYEDVDPKQVYLHNISVSKGKVQLHPKLV